MRITLAAAAVLCAGVAPGTELSPREGTRESEGVARPQLEFSDAPRGNAFYELPAGWSWVENKGELVLTADEPASTTAIIRRKPVAEAEKLPTEPEQRLDWARARAPREAEEVAFIESAPAGIQIDGVEPLAATFGYRYFGREFRVTVWLLNRPSEQLQFHLTSPAAAHEETTRRFRRSLFTLHWEQK